MKTKLLTIYYLLLVSFVSFSVIQTVYEGSLYISHGKTIATLNREQTELLNKQTKLQAKLSHEISLSQVASEAAQQNYQTITQPLAIADTLPTTVASR